MFSLQWTNVASQCGGTITVLRSRTAEQKVEALLTLSKRQAAERVRQFDEESRRLRNELDRYAEFIAKANEPTLLPSWDFEVLHEISQKTYRDPRGNDRQYLTAEEVQFLSIPRGSLDAEERRQQDGKVEPLTEAQLGVEAGPLIEPQ